MKSKFFSDLRNWEWPPLEPIKELEVKLESCGYEQKHEYVNEEIDKEFLGLKWLEKQLEEDLEE